MRSPQPSIIKKVTLRVHDLGGTLAFYRDVVGLQLVGQAGGRATLGHAGQGVVDWGVDLLELEEDRGAPPRRRDEAGLFHVAFRLPHERHLAQALRRITGRHRLEGAADHGFSRALYLRDPEGNGVEIYVDRPEEEWPREPSGRLALFSRPLDLQALLGAHEGRAASIPPGVDVGHVHLEVASIAEARAFCVELLGLQVTGDGGGVLFVAHGGYHHHVGLNTWGGRPRPRRPDALGLQKISASSPTGAQASLDGARRLGLSASRVDGRIEVVDPSGITWVIGA